MKTDNKECNRESEDIEGRKKAALELRIKELEAKLSDKDHEIEKLQTEKTAIKSQVEGLLNELDTLEVA